MSKPITDEQVLDIIDHLSELRGYVPAYFAEKWGHDDEIDRIQDFLGYDPEGNMRPHRVAEQLQAHKDKQAAISESHRPLSD